MKSLKIPMFSMYFLPEDVIFWCHRKILRTRRVSWDELKTRLAEANWKEAPSWLRQRSKSRDKRDVLHREVDFMGLYSDFIGDSMEY